MFTPALSAIRWPAFKTCQSRPQKCNRRVKKFSFRRSALTCTCPLFLVVYFLYTISQFDKCIKFCYRTPTHKHESTRADPLSWLSLSERSCSSPILPGPSFPRHTKESSVELSMEKTYNQLVTVG